jgi:hypothetical protein
VRIIKRLFKGKFLSVVFCSFTKQTPNTAPNRRKEIKRITKQLSYVPSGDALKKFYNLPEKFDELCNVIDKDIKSLT